MAHNDRTLTYHLNRVAGTLVNDQPTLTDVAAANLWAGTTDFELVEALNSKANNFNPRASLGLARVVQTLALVPRDYGVDEAASYL